MIILLLFFFCTAVLCVETYSALVLFFFTSHIYFLSYKRLLFFWFYFHWKRVLCGNQNLCMQYNAAALFFQVFASVPCNVQTSNGERESVLSKCKQKGRKVGFKDCSTRCLFCLVPLFSPQPCTLRLLCTHCRTRSFFPEVSLFFVYFIHSRLWKEITK